MRTVEMTMEIASAIGRTIDLLQSNGDTVVSGHNFVEYKQIVARAKRDLTEHFSIDLHTITPPEGFWMVILDAQEQPVGTVAARLDLLGPMSLDEHWRIYLPRIYKAEDGGPVEIGARQHSFCQEIQGRVVYLGEMWIEKNRRKEGLGKRFAHLVQLASALHLDADYVWCWMWQENAEGGFAQACGYSEIVRNGIRWKKPPAGNSSLKDLWLAGSQKSRLHDLALSVLHGALED